MSTTLTGPTRVAKERARSFHGDETRYFHDLDPLRSFDERFPVVEIHTPTTRVGVFKPDWINAVSALDYASDAHLRDACWLAGSSLADMTFEVCDRTSIYKGGIRRVEVDRLLSPQRELHATVGLESGADAEDQITADHDYPITGSWLAAAYQVIFKPIEREDVDPDFDPDDYPLV